MRSLIFLLSFLGSTATWAQVGEVDAVEEDASREGLGGVSARVTPVTMDPVMMDDLSIAEDIESVWVVVIEDRADVLSSQAPSGRLGRIDRWHDLHFNDEGVFPDGNRGDRQYVAWLALERSAQEFNLEIYDADGQTIFIEIGIPVPQQRVLPKIAILLMPDGQHVPTYETHDLDDWSDAQVLDHDVVVGIDSTNSSTDISSSVNTTSESEESREEFVAMVSRGVLIGCIAILAVVLWFLWRIRTRIIRENYLIPMWEAEEKNGEDSRREVLSILGEQALIEELVTRAQKASHFGRVLVCPRAQSRERLRMELVGMGTVVWSSRDNPSAEDVVEMARHLEGWGRVSILVDGLDALESAGPEEATDSVLKELMSCLPATIDLCVLLVEAGQDRAAPPKSSLLS